MTALFIAYAALPYVLAVLLGLSVPLIALGAYNNLMFGTAFIALAWLADALNLGQPVLRLGLTVYAPDLPLILIALVAALRWLLRKDVPRRHAAWVLVAVVFFIGLGWGLAQNGTAAGVQSRPDFYGIAAASYAMSFAITRLQLRQMLQAFTALAVVLLLICVYRWVVYYTPIPELLPPGGRYNVDGAIRVIRSNDAIGLAQVFVLGLFFGGVALGLRSAQMLSPLLLAGTVVLQHRSVWLAGIVGVLLCLMLARQQKAALWQQLFLGIAVVAATAAPLAFNSALSSQLGSSAGRAIEGQGSVAERFQNWRATLDLWAGDGPRAIAIGRLRGSDTRRIIDDGAGHDIAISYSAHNHYVNTLSGMGVVGLGALLWIVGYAVIGLVRLVRRHDDDSPASALLLVLIGMQLVYYVAYGIDFLQNLMLGVAVAWVAQRWRAPLGAAAAAAASAASPVSAPAGVPRRAAGGSAAGRGA